jgi:hypothetical protein
VAFFDFLNSCIHPFSSPVCLCASPYYKIRGKYYKNVRSEWASLVATPPHALFQDALAFTRSLGDLHLQTYGVSFLPEVGLVVHVV